jgi:hypothetical protein
MVRVATRIEFPNDDPGPMLTHLDRWATGTLTSPEAWASVLERCGQWQDYSPRNQVLLASYGIVTPVAGVATWELVPSREDGRPCAVRAGEHGLPVRAPVEIPVATTSPRSRGGQHTVRAVGQHKWEMVFAEEQLARRPPPGQLAWPTLPAELSGAKGHAAYTELVRQSIGRLTGRTPRTVKNPWDQLVHAAGRVPLGGRRPELRPALCRQAAWLAADRVGHAEGPLPAFDPIKVRGRIRWELLADTRRAAQQLVQAFSHIMEVDLSASPLPRMAVADDRTVTPGRRNYLAPADVAALPLGVWVEAGPYTAIEWAARGMRDAVGRAGFMRVSDTGYLAVYESSEGARWRIESTRPASGRRGLLDEGEASTFAAAQQAVGVVVSDRYPTLASTVLPPAIAPAPTGVFDRQHSTWRPLTLGRDERSEQRDLTDRVRLVVAPGPGGRWDSWVLADNDVRQLPLTVDSAAAKTAAETEGRRTIVQHAVQSPQLADELIHNAASAGTLTRQLLVDVIGHRLDPADRARFTDPTLPATDLAELLSSTGAVTPPTIVTVLAHERVDAKQVATLIPTVGLPITEGVRALSELWDVDRVAAGQMLGATMLELRDAGCTPAELLAAHPREVLRSLDARPHTWELAAATLIETGMTAEAAVRQLAAHAPTPDAFAVAVFTIVEDPIAAYAYSARHAQPDDLAALGEQYGLDPDTAAQLLADAGTHPTTAIEALTIACDGDTITVEALALRHFNRPAEAHVIPVIDLTTGAGLRAALPSPTAIGSDDLAKQLAELVSKSPDPLSLAARAQPEF